MKSIKIPLWPGKLLTIIGILVLYVGTYMLFMQRNVGAYRGGKKVFQSSFILARSDPTPRAPGGMTFTMPGVTVLNYVYYPLDVVWFAFDGR